MGLLRVQLGGTGRRLNVNGRWIAATALTHRIPVVTQDDDFRPVEGVGGLRVVHVWSSLTSMARRARCARIRSPP